MALGFTTTYGINALHVVSSNLDQDEVYSNVIKFVSDLQQFGDFLWFTSPIKLIATI